MFYALSDFFSPVSLRALAAFFTALLIALACGSRLIEFLHHHQSKGQPIREDGPQSHLLTKKGTPTMGGLLILGSCIFSTLLWADLNNYFIWISLLVLLIYGTTGFVDDYVKVTKQTANAMTARMKLVLQFSTALIASAVISYATPEAYRYSLTIPYFRDLALNLCWFYIPFAMIVITGASNAVNLSDGLDGLASGLLICSFAVFMLIAYTCGTAVSRISPLLLFLPPVKLPSSVPQLSAAVSAFFGSMPPKPKSSWETPVLWRSALCWEPSPS